MFCLDGYFVSVFFVVLNSSRNYRSYVISNLSKNDSNSCDSVIAMKLKTPKQEVIDLKWNDMVERLVFERKEMDHAMSWLSTLGGAFSALGDSFEHCAKVAGRISVQQFKIALKLGEPPLAARCKLYMALSLIQQGNLKVARKIILDQYEVGKSFKDTRLQNMCKGIWSKLQYVTKLCKSG